MKKSKKKITLVSVLTFATALASVAVSTAIYSAVEAILTISAAPAFSAIDQSTGETYYCYRISERNDAVAIAWGSSDRTSTPADLTISDTVVSNTDGQPYTVAAIAKGGFARCDFNTITLPQTIEEIREGAFSYCENLELFTLPYSITTVYPSTFLDCRSLRTISYTDRAYDSVNDTYEYFSTNSNNKITRIEDHAFDSCISLIQFDCPESVTYFGKCCFQNCSSFTRFYLPSKITEEVEGEQVQKYGNIEIDKYAFTDCTKLVWVYFEENLTTVRDYAFTNCNTNLVFHYGYEGATRSDPEFDTYWRRKALDSDNSSVYSFETSSHVLIYSADGYPGLKIGLENTDVYLNSYHNNGLGVANTIKVIENSSTYAVIYQWNNPGGDVRKAGDDFYYYRYATGELTIPGSVSYGGVSYPVKVIKEEAFREKDELRIIHFKDGIVQICARAFYQCVNLEQIDFDGVTTLKEIGNDMFNKLHSETNTGVTSIALPACLEYLGKYSFYNFINVSSLSFRTPSDVTNNRSPKLKVIGGYAFARIGWNLNRGVINLVLPNTLDDETAYKAQINYQENVNGKNNWSDRYQNWAAIGPFALGTDDLDNEANRRSAIASITMEAATPETASLTASIAPNCFFAARYLTRFVANTNLCFVGTDAFKSCLALKEVFFTTAKAQSFADSHPNQQIVWGTKNGGGSIEQSPFSGVACPNTVIYLDGQAPGSIETISDEETNATYSRWNTEGLSSSSYAIDLSYQGFGRTTSEHNDNYRVAARSTIPTFYDMDFDFDTGSVLYYKISTGTFLTTPPVTDSEYYQGIIIFARSSGSNNYTAVKYYCDKDSDQDEIDLRDISYELPNGTTVEISDNLVAIGPEAFASQNTSESSNSQSPMPGRYFM